jgi:hypothetical protein
MPLVEVFGHLLTDDVAVRYEKIGVPTPRLRRHLERHMEQLADMGIETRIGGDMADRRRQPWAIP